MENLDTIEAARKYFAGDIYATETTGIEILEVREHYAKCHFTADHRHENAAGLVMGGAIYTLTDFTFAVAANSGGTHTVTASSSISFLSGAKGKELYAEAVMIKEGRSTSVYEVRVTDDLDTLIAVCMLTGAHVPKH